ncbi:hypothetical protein OMK68_19860 [Rhodococcus pyridinivorans]|uniref:hypothetical protein n=1 Tax=Rhodococcus pyridinivorans TaxID=103816 RepID=UPI002227EB5D|nr:hypothetical protein [Rhodococcus pyridinivorans]MCW3471863.1 hypothetical protein [Rhodococcus pyridinivorans]
MNNTDDDTTENLCLRERLVPFGEEMTRETIAQHIRAACAMAGDLGGEDPRDIIEQIEAGLTREDILNEFRRGERPEG